MFFQWAIPGFFSIIFVFSTVIIKYMLVVSDWIGTVDLGCQKQLLCQLSHNYCHQNVC